MNKIESIIRKATKGIFSENFYKDVSVEILNTINESEEFEDIAKYTEIDIPNDMLDYFDQIDLLKGKRIDKNKLRNNFNTEMWVTQRKLTYLFEKYLKHKGIKYRSGRTNSSRYIEVL